MAGYHKDWPPFQQARDQARRLRLGSRAAWLRYRPLDLPSSPGTVYAGQGWRGWYDWLGKPGFPPYPEARERARRAGIRSIAEWKSDRRPTGLPSNPDRIYAGRGWTNWYDWLGKARFPEFAAARAQARLIGIRSAHQWCRQRPQHLPSNPAATYARRGWAGWPDWLGTD